MVIVHIILHVLVITFGCSAIEDVFGDDIDEGADPDIRKISKLKLPHEQREESRLIQTDLTPAEVRILGCFIKLIRGINFKGSGYHIHML